MLKPFVFIIDHVFGFIAYALYYTLYIIFYPVIWIVEKASKEDIEFDETEKFYH